MNNCVFVGRMVVDPELRYTQSGIANCSFRIAVKRRFTNGQGEHETDFIQCVAWRQSAEYVCNYIHKGDKVAVSGALQNRMYQAQDGSTRYVSEIIVDQISGCGGRKQEEPKQEEPAPVETVGSVEADDDGLPF